LLPFVFLNHLFCFLWKKNESFFEKISNSYGGALWLGEHHNSISDHNLQVTLLRELSNRRKNGSIVAVGLEQVQVQFQPVLDSYNQGIITLDEMRDGVEWDTRWIWPFEGYAPVFLAARELGMPLVALNVNSEDMTLVEKGGFPGLGGNRLKAYIRDGYVFMYMITLTFTSETSNTVNQIIYLRFSKGFDDFSQQQQFRTYINYVIMPSYELHQEMGLLQYTMSGEKLPEVMPFRNFLSGRLLWDEAMASNAVDWTRKNPGGLIVGLVGADHGTFR
jgi:Haem-binding uptake, Tiki superfamily, ChaN